MRPRLGNGDYKTYAIRSPLATHFRVASCEEFNCPAHAGGWTIRLEGLNAKLAHVARNSGRRWQEMEVAPGETYLVYEPGQQCFQTHRLPLDRPQQLYIGRGKWTSFKLRDARQVSDVEFVEDWMSNSDILTRYQERG